MNVYLNGGLLIGTSFYFTFKFMSGIQQSQYAEILFSCIEENYLKEEISLGHHSFARVIPGEMKVIQGDRSYTFGPGDTLIFPCNQLSTLIKNPKDGLAYKAIVIFFSPERLKEFYIQNPIPTSVPVVRKIKSFEKHPLLESYFASLVPYFDLKSELPEKLVSAKIAEALQIIHTLDKSIDYLLADFSQPEKINLAEFMEKNYMFNITLGKFSYLTGRSLTTFKRDFKKSFNSTPHKWIIQKRLELAHYQIAEKGRKPVDVYPEAGFEDLSHFSFAFKKHFGYAPTDSKYSVVNSR